VTDEEWSLIEPFIPAEKGGGRHREVDMRAVFNGVMYVLSTGCQWRYIPKDLPPKSTVYRYFYDWGYDGTLDRIHAMLYTKCGEQAGRKEEPTGSIIDSQSVKGAEKGGWIDPHGYDAGKKIKGKKRHLLVDTLGLLMMAIIHPADIQDRDGGVLLLKDMKPLYPLLTWLLADAGYQGPKFRNALAKIIPRLKAEIVKRSDQAKGLFVVLPKRSGLLNARLLG
jgi:putative transposase